MGLINGPLASISENGIAFGVRIKHGKGQNKTKQNKNTWGRGGGGPQSKRGNWNQLRENEMT